MLALKRKVKHHFMKQGDTISKGDNTKATFYFHSLQLGFNHFLFPK
jgi:hypothetical protein